jgi:hypothetical protein
VRASNARTIADQKEMRRQITRLEKIGEGWTEKAELALSKGREDLAKAALMEKRKLADVADGLRAEIQMLDDALRASEADIAKLQGKLREARARQSAVQSRLESAHNRTRARECMPAPRSTRRSAASTSWNAAPTWRRAMPMPWASASAKDARGRDCRTSRRQSDRRGARSHEGPHHRGRRLNQIDRRKP